MASHCNKTCIAVALGFLLLHSSLSTSSLSEIACMQMDNADQACRQDFWSICDPRSADKVPKKDFKGQRKRKGRISQVPDDAESKKDQSDLTVFRRENITVSPDKFAIHVELPSPMKIGMKMTASGASGPFADCLLSFPMDYKHPLNLLSSLTVTVDWKKKKIGITKGLLDKDFFKGHFPIQDPSNFTFGVVLEPKSSKAGHFFDCCNKVYVDSVLVTKQKRIHELADVSFMRFSRIHRLVVQKTGKGSDKMHNDMP